MPFVYDLETDIRFKQGVEAGIQRGIEKGIEKANKDLKKQKRNMIVKMLKSEVFAKGFLSLQDIANFANEDLQFVKKTKEDLDKKSNKKKK